MTTIERLKFAYHRLRGGANLHRNDALGALFRAWAYVHATQLAGDYYEFGVYRGNSLAHAWLSYRHHRRHLEHCARLPYRRKGTVSAFLAQRPRFYGFDTFVGMPANLEGEDSLAAGSFFATQAQAQARCAAVGLKAPDLQLVPGLFTDNAQAIGRTPAAIVHMDCDLYSSAHDALTLIAPRLVQGSVMLCDDYDLFRADHQQGERRALQECAARFGIAFEPWFAYAAASRAFLCHVPTLAPAPQP
ncbi:TylF/MycF family methyltransferase [Xanthomonas cassavae CFBP 4642]|uniref:TylF/MycF family methyltransferase n=1 Tax=Xanthomonas cassavae CFBP 4642 TaxID=1219375 RepID=A0ABS8HC36_9XANT|nr:TylF/MycF family methyltransferase [Xanthomonas cassavae]MCC4619696.1 TylF/MycF family methyltransferase [Xanthomonas cassavae CFBP 4642]